MEKGWSGRKVARLIAQTLADKGTFCHLCGDGGADSADHEPPRSVLIADGEPDPDALIFLWPAHRRCNYRRQARPLTAQLLADLQAKRKQDLEPTARSPLSPRFARNRPSEV